MKLLKIALTWLLSLCLLATIIGFAIDAPHLVLLQREHAETSGRVTRVLPGGHSGVEVAYVVADRAYVRPFFPYLQDGRAAKGDSVRIYYSPQDPAIAFIAPPGEILEGQIPSWIAGSILGSLGITAMALALAARLSRWARVARRPPG